MTLPPLVARVLIRTPDRHLRLWVPLFLLWLLLLPLLVPLVLVAAVVGLFVPRWRVGPIARGVLVAVCEARGTVVDVDGPRSRVSIALH